MAGGGPVVALGICSVGPEKVVCIWEKPADVGKELSGACLDSKIGSVAPCTGTGATIAGAPIDLNGRGAGAEVGEVSADSCGGSGDRGRRQSGDRGGTCGHRGREGDFPEANSVSAVVAQDLQPDITGAGRSGDIK